MKAYNQKREELFFQVKAIYADMADKTDRLNPIQSTAKQTPEAQYEALLQAALQGISEGQFDHCTSGREVVDLMNARSRPGQG
jgi:hypothetical protein